MKILQIAPPWIDIPPKTFGGTEWVIANLVKGFTELGHSVTLFATKNSHSLGYNRYVFEKALLEQGYSWNSPLPVLVHYHQALKDAKKFDMVHAHLSSTTDLVILPFLADLTQRGIPNVLTIHSRWPFDRYSHMDQMFLKLYGNKILAVSISKSMHKTLPKQFRDGGVVYNSMDINKMKFNPKGGNYLTWLGKIIPEKGIAEAIKIAKKAGKQLIFAGVVDELVEKSAKYWHKEVKPLIDGKQIQYLGPADLRLKNKMLGGAKAFLNPLNWDEPFGMVLAESLACGTPVISFNKGAVGEVVKDGYSGFLVGNKSQMQNAIAKIDSIKRENCRKYVEDHFSPKSAAAGYLKIYQKEIKSKKKPGNGRIIRKKIIHITEAEVYKFPAVSLPTSLPRLIPV